MTGMPLHNTGNLQPESKRNDLFSQECDEVSRTLAVQLRRRDRLEFLRKRQSVSFSNSSDSTSSNNSSDAEDEERAMKDEGEADHDLINRVLPSSTPTASAVMSSFRRYKIRRSASHPGVFTENFTACSVEPVSSSRRRKLNQSKALSLGSADFSFIAQFSEAIHISDFEAVHDKSSNKAMGHEREKTNKNEQCYTPPSSKTMSSYGAAASGFRLVSDRWMKSKGGGQRHVRRHSLPAAPGSTSRARSSSHSLQLNNESWHNQSPDASSPSIDRFRSISFGYPYVPTSSSPRKPSLTSDVKRMHISTMPGLSGPIGKSVRSSSASGSGTLAERPIEEVIPNFEYLHFSLLRHTLRRDVAPDEILSREDCLAVMNSKLSDVALQEEDTSFPVLSQTPNSPQRSFLCGIHTTAAEQLQHMNKEMNQHISKEMSKFRQRALRLRQEEMPRRIMKVSHKLKTGDLDFMAVPHVTENEILLEETFSTCSPRDRERFAPAVVAVVKSKSKNESDCGSNAVSAVSASKSIEGEKSQSSHAIENGHTIYNEALVPGTSPLWPRTFSTKPSTAPLTKTNETLYNDNCEQKETSSIHSINQRQDLVIAKLGNTIVASPELGESTTHVCVLQRVTTHSTSLSYQTCTSPQSNSTLQVESTERNVSCIETKIDATQKLECCLHDEFYAGTSVGQYYDRSTADIEVDHFDYNISADCNDYCTSPLLKVKPLVLYEKSSTNQGESCETLMNDNQKTTQLDIMPLTCNENPAINERESCDSILNDKGSIARPSPFDDTTASSSSDPSENGCQNSNVSAQDRCGSSAPRDTTSLLFITDPFPEEPPPIGRITQLPLDSISTVGGALSSHPFPKLDIADTGAVVALDDLSLAIKSGHDQFSQTFYHAESRVIPPQESLLLNCKSIAPERKCSPSEFSPSLESPEYHNSQVKELQLNNKQTAQGDVTHTDVSRFDPILRKTLSADGPCLTSKTSVDGVSSSNIPNLGNDDILMSCSFTSLCSPVGLEKTPETVNVGELLSEHHLSLMSLSPGGGNDLSNFSTTEGSEGTVSNLHLSEHNTPGRFRRRLANALTSKKNTENDTTAEDSSSQFLLARNEVSPGEKNLSSPKASSSTVSGVLEPQRIRRKLLLPDLSDVLTGEDMTDVDLLDNYMYCNHNQGLNNKFATTTSQPRHVPRAYSPNPKHAMYVKADPIEEDLSINVSASEKSTFSQRPRANPAISSASEDDFEHPFAKSSRSLGFIGLVNSAAVDNFCESSSLKNGEICNVDIISSSCNSISHAVEIVLGFLPSADDLSQNCSTDERQRIQGASCKDALLQCWNDVHTTNVCNANRAPCGGPPVNMSRQYSAKNKCRVHGQLFTPPTLKLRSQSLINLPEDEIPAFNGWSSDAPGIRRLNNGEEDYSYMNPRWAMAVQGSDGSPYPERAGGHGRPPPIPIGSDLAQGSNFEGRLHPGLPVARKYFQSSIENSSHLKVSRHFSRAADSSRLVKSNERATDNGNDFFFGSTYKEDSLVLPSQSY